MFGLFKKKEVYHSIHWFNLSNEQAQDLTYQLLRQKLPKEQAQQLTDGCKQFLDKTYDDPKNMTVDPREIVKFFMNGFFNGQ